MIDIIRMAIGTFEKTNQPQTMSYIYRHGEDESIGHLLLSVTDLLRGTANKSLFNQFSCVCFLCDSGARSVRLQQLRQLSPRHGYPSRWDVRLGQRLLECLSRQPATSLPKSLPATRTCSKVVHFTCSPSAWRQELVLRKRGCKVEDNLQFCSNGGTSFFACACIKSLVGVWKLDGALLLIPMLVVFCPCVRLYLSLPGFVSAWEIVQCTCSFACHTSDVDHCGRELLWLNCPDCCRQIVLQSSVWLLLAIGACYWTDLNKVLARSLLGKSA